MKVDLLGIIGAIAGLIGAGGGYWFGARKQKAEAKQVETAVVSENLVLYQKLIDDLSQRFDARIKELHEEYEQKIIELEREIGQLRAELKKYKNAS